MTPLNPIAKSGLVAAGYAAAFLVASQVVAAHVAATASDRQGSDGMYAFGDSLYFLFAFAGASIPAMGAWVFFLRPYRTYWRALSVALLVGAGTLLAAGILGFLTPLG